MQGERSRWSRGSCVYNRIILARPDVLTTVDVNILECDAV